jgi:Domain of unknown function (DUF4157)
MGTHTDKTQNPKSRSVINDISPVHGNSEPGFVVEDNRNEAASLKESKAKADQSAQAIQLKGYQEMANNSPQTKALRSKQAIADNYTSQKTQKTGNLPDEIQTKMENSFGADFSEVKIHTNSKTAEDLNAIAYTQGNDIYFASGYNPYSSQGQEYLGHELSHVIQQKAGIVKTTNQESGFNINADNALESMADEAGKRAASGQPAAMNINPLSKPDNTSIQKKDAPIQLLKQSIPGSAFILDVNTTPDIVLQGLIHVAALASRQYSDVNWRQLFLPAIEAQIRGRQLGSISHAWSDTSGIDMDWQVNISFSMDTVTPTGRTDDRQVTNSQGGSSAPSLGSSQTVTTGQTATATGSGTNAPGGVGGGGSLAVGVNDSTARGQSQGTAGGITGGQSQTSGEKVSRFNARLYAAIDVSATAGYSNFDIINPVKWGAHLAGNLTANKTMHIGNIIFDRPNY